MEPPPRPVGGGFATRAVHAGRVPEVAQRPVSPPIHPSATWAVERSSDLGDLLTDRLDGYVYGRYDNPTNSALHAQFAALHGAPAAWSLASGTAAIHAALGALRGNGRVLASRHLYGGTHALLERLRQRAAWPVDTVDLTDPDALAGVLTDEHTVVHVETIGNPTLALVDLERVAATCRERGTALVVDNTFASPYLCRPLELGATLVVESATKYLGGHGDVVAGVVAGPRELVAAVREAAYEEGASLGPFEAWLVSRGIHTLELRVSRACASASVLAHDLTSDPRVHAVRYPGLPSHPQHGLACRLFGDRGFGATIALDLDDRGRAERFADACEVFAPAASLGATHSLVLHPASTSHRQLDDAALAAAGIGPGVVRLSVGVEDLPDLRADVARALEVAHAEEVSP